VATILSERKKLQIVPPKKAADHEATVSELPHVGSLPHLLHVSATRHTRDDMSYRYFTDEYEHWQTLHQ
jgi:hypothetical protein